MSAADTGAFDFSTTGSSHDVSSRSVMLSFDATSSGFRPNSAHFLRSSTHLSLRTVDVRTSVTFTTSTPFTTSFSVFFSTVTTGSSSRGGSSAQILSRVARGIFFSQKTVEEKQKQSITQKKKCLKKDKRTKRKNKKKTKKWMMSK